MASQNIFAQFAQPVRSVADYAAEYDAQDIRKLQLQGAQRQNALAGLTAEQTRQGIARNALVQAAQRTAAEGAGGDEAAYAKALRLSGYPELIDSADKVDKAAGERVKLKSENAKRDTETENAVVTMWRDMIGNAVNPQQAAQMVAAMHADPRIANTPIARVPLGQGLAMLHNTPFDQWKQQFALGAAKFVEMNKPQYITQNLGGMSRVTAVPGLGAGPAVAVTESPITQSADNRASVGAQYANAAAARDQAQAVRDAAKISARAGDETALRKEFADLPEVKKYKNAIPAYQAIVKSSQTNNPQADINLIYGLAKLYDPDSVVREGEYDTIANSQSIPEWLKGQAQRMAGGGKLTPATKAQIIEQANIRIGAYKSEVDGARASYDKITKGRGLDPENVFPAVGEQVSAGGGLSVAEKAELEQLRNKLGRK